MELDGAGDKSNNRRTHIRARAVHGTGRRAEMCVLDKNDMTLYDVAQWAFEKLVDWLSEPGNEMVFRMPYEMPGGD